MYAYERIVIAGGSGYIGRVLAAHYSKLAKEVVILTRGKGGVNGNINFVHWDGRTIGSWTDSLIGCDVLINLTGKSVDCRYNEKNKAEIFASRLNATRVLGEALRVMAVPPKVWFNAASATIYRHAEDRPQDEYDGEIGEGFSVEVCKQWEHAFFEQRIPGVRMIALRIGIVLGRHGGVAKYYLNLARFGMGGIQGDGQQRFSWIHEEDLTASMDFLLQRKDIDGIFNLTSPNPIINGELMRTTREVVGVPFGLPATRWMLQIGTWLLQTEVELILKSRWVLPTRLIHAGYQFKVPFIKGAVERSV